MNGYSFEDLEVYKIAREFRKKIYGLTKELPEEEKYNLTSQMRRAAVSMTNCIAKRTWAFPLSRRDSVLKTIQRLDGGTNR